MYLLVLVLVQVMECFRGFMEDYNTATMPHLKVPTLRPALQVAHAPFLP